MAALYRAWQRVLIEREQLEDARAYLNTALRERPDYPAVAFAQARVAFEEGDLHSWRPRTRATGSTGAWS